MKDAQILETSERTVICSLDQQFLALHDRSRQIISATLPDSLYLRPALTNLEPGLSVAENVLRAAAAVEQTFGGITANLWDDPFEWTLPEYLSTPERIIEYLDEVEALRRSAFLSFVRDADLQKEIMGPAGETVTLIELLAQILVRAAKSNRSLKQ